MNLCCDNRSQTWTYTSLPLSGAWAQEHNWFADGLYTGPNLTTAGQTGASAGTTPTGASKLRQQLNSVHAYVLSHTKAKFRDTV